MFRRVLHPSRARLSRRIVLWVFISVIVIEAIILIPSYQRRKKELLTHLKEYSLAKFSLILQISPPNVSDQKLFEQIKMLQGQSGILGGALYTSDGKVIGFFGERPEVSFADIKSTDLVYYQSEQKARYDLVCVPNQLQRKYTLILRHDASSVQKELYAFILRIAGLVVIISVFVTAGAWFALEPIVVTPILRLRGDLIKAGNAISEDQETPEFYSVSIQRQDELGEVIIAFRQMYHQISDAINRRRQAEAALQLSLKQVEDYSQALNSELEKGREIQTNFLPAQLHQKSGWEFAAYFMPARQVAGDFYDTFELPGNCMGIVIADVCDKGVGAALFMALFRSLIRIFSGQTSLEGMTCMYFDAPENEEDAIPEDQIANPTYINPLKAVRLTNTYIAQNHSELAMFSTLFFGVLDLATGTLTYINGGHDPLFIIKSSGSIGENLSPTGPAVGVQLNAKFEMKQTRLAAGEILFGYTDGVTEARNANDEFFSEKQLLSLLETEASDAADLLKRISVELKNHTGDAEQYDDITMLAVRRSFRSNEPPASVIKR